MKQNNLFGLSEKVIKKIHDVFIQYKGINKVILYGSRAKGTNRYNSDIDLCIEGEMLNLTQLLKIENELDDLLLPWKIDLCLKHQIDNPDLLQHIQNEGIIFYPLHFF
jgi:predicted nucleotidyltransferase